MVPQRCRDCRSWASSGGGSVSGGVTPSQPAASPSRPRKIVRMTRVIIVPPGSPQRERDRDLVRGGADLLQADGPARRDEDAAARQRESAVDDPEGAGRGRHPRATGPPRDATAVADLQIRESETHTPGGGPLEPRLLQRVSDGLEVIRLRQV